MRRIVALCWDFTSWHHDVMTSCVCDCHVHVQTLQKYPVTTFCAAATGFRMLIRENPSRYNFPTLRHCLSGGEAVVCWHRDSLWHVGLSLQHRACYEVTSPNITQLVSTLHREANNCKIFTALHEMQTRSSDENSVCPSVYHTRDPWQNGRKIGPDFYTIRKNIYPSFLRTRMSPSSSLLLLAKTITHPAARSLCDSWASCIFATTLWNLFILQ